MAADIYFCPFVLKQKDQKFKADIMGLPHLATAPPPCRPGPRAQPGRDLAFPHTAQGRKTALMDNSPAPYRHRGHRPAISLTARGLSPCRRFASLRGTKRSIYDRFAEDLFPKNPFHFQPLTRQQTTTNDYSRLQTFNQRVGLDKVCIFVV